MIDLLVKFGQFLLSHGDLVTDVMDAIEHGGVEKEALRKMIRDAIVAASEERMRQELGG